MAVLIRSSFVEFLEGSNWAINPDDPVVKDIKANVAGPADTVEHEVRQSGACTVTANDVCDSKTSWSTLNTSSRIVRNGSRCTSSIVLIESAGCSPGYVMLNFK